jgi:hypothetical protein
VSCIICKDSILTTKVTCASIIKPFGECYVGKGLSLPEESYGIHKYTM